MHRQASLRAVALGALVALALAALAPPAGAFASLPPGTSPHDDITAVAAELGFPADAVRALQQAVREPDMRDSEYDPQVDEPTRTDADREYRPWHHCDREPGTRDADAFNATSAYVAQQRDEARNASAAGDSGGAVAALGQALHALQDCYSHSNAVDLPPGAQRGLREALLAGGPAVPGLRLVAYDPGADEPGRPEGDPYGHDDFCKDSPDANGESRARLADGRTKHEAAVGLAREATAAFLQGFVDGLPEPERAGLMDEAPEGGGLPDDVPVPGPALPVALATLAAVGWAACRRGPR